MACEHGCWEDVQEAQRIRAAAVAAYNASLLIPAEAPVVPVEAPEVVEATPVAPEAEIASEGLSGAEEAAVIEEMIEALINSDEAAAEELAVEAGIVAPAEEEVVAVVPKASRRK